MRTRIGRRLGGPAARRRRHRRAALLAFALAVVAGALIVAGADDAGDDAGDGVEADAIVAACRASNERIATAQRALLGDNDAPTAAEEFLADAFVDLTRERSAAIRAVEPPPSPEVLAVLDEFDAVVDAIEADPTIGLGADPFEAVDQRWQALGLDECEIGGSTVDG